MELTTRQKAAFGIGAVGKDMVYALSASYVMYYYQDVIGLRLLADPIRSVGGPGAGGGPRILRRAEGSPDAAAPAAA